MKFSETTCGVALKTFLYTVLAALLCFFLNMSVTMALSISATEKLGTRTGGVLADGRTLVMEEHYATDDAPAHRKVYIIEDDQTETVLIDRDLSDAEDTEADAELLEQYPVTRSYAENIRTPVRPGLQSTANWVTQILMLIIFLAFPYSNLWYIGDHDRNAVLFGHRAEDKWRGAKIGLLADLPALAMWLLLVAGKLTGGLPGFVKWYRWMNVCFWPWFNHVIPAGTLDPAAVSWGGVAAMLPVLLSLPLLTGLGYFLGYSEISLRDRLVYTATGKKVKHRRKK